MPAVKSKLDAIIAKFAQDLETAIRQEIREQLLAAVDSGVTPRAGAPARAKGKGRRTAKATPQAKKRVRRSAEAIGEVQEKVVKLLSQGTKLSSEEIQEKLGLDKQEIQRPLQLLRESAEVKTVGEKRSMRYFVGAGRASVVKRTKAEAAE